MIGICLFIFLVAQVVQLIVLPMCDEIWILKWVVLINVSFTIIFIFTYPL